MHLRPVKQPHLFFATTTTAAAANSAFSPTDLHQGLYPPRCQAPEFPKPPKTDAQTTTNIRVPDHDYLAYLTRDFKSPPAQKSMSRYRWRLS